MNLYSLKVASLVFLILVDSIICSNETLKNRHQFIVEESGVTNTDLGSIALVFYVVVNNPNTDPLKVDVTADKCCIEEENMERNCDVMALYGGQHAKLTSKESKSFSFIYPSLYIHDMVGHCVIMVSVEQTTQIINITFNTMLEYRKPVPWLPDFISDFLFDTKIPRKCKSRDEDRFGNCYPVQCDIKYHGKRNFFDLGTRLCIPQITCDGENVEHKVYDSETNSCKDRSTSKTNSEETMPDTEVKFDGFEVVDWTIERRIHCNHGIMAPNRSTCICHPGWDSLVLPNQNIDNKTGLLQMCDIGKEGYWKHALAGIGFAATIIAVLHISNLMCKNKKSKRYRELSPHSSPEKSTAEQHSIQLDDSHDTSTEYERANVFSRMVQKLKKKFRPSKEERLDFSMEEINVGKTSLSPVTMDEDYEIG